MVRAALCKPNPSDLLQKLSSSMRWPIMQGTASWQSGTQSSTHRRVAAKHRRTCKIRKHSLSSILVSGPMELNDTPPVFFFLKLMAGGGRLSRMPTDSSSWVRIWRCACGLLASRTMSNRSALLHTAMTCRPRPTLASVQLQV